MNSHKPLLHILACAGIFTLSLNAKTPSDATFEFVNKLDFPVYISMGSGTTNPLELNVIAIKKGGTTYARLDINKPTKLFVSLQREGAGTLYEFPNGKTIYVRIKKDGSSITFGPQTGRLMGLSGETESGLSLKNNVRKSDIKEKTVIYGTPLFYTGRYQPAAYQALGVSIKATPREILGVSATASNKAITTAYRKLSLKWHPDKNKNKYATEVFKLINEAYNTLMAKQKPAIRG